MSLDALRRKLRALAALAADAGATEHEKANAQALRVRLAQQLKDAGAPAGDWSDTLFRLGRRLRQVQQDTAPAAPKGDWSDGMFRLGKALGRSAKRANGGKDRTGRS